MNEIMRQIASKRDERLVKSKVTCDYEFCVAHGMSEALRIITKKQRERRKFLESVIDHYGEENQIRKSIEELTELSLALQHFLKDCETKTEVLGNVLEEIAYVQIMTEQLMIIFEGHADKIDEIKQIKLARLKKMIEESR